MFILLTHDARYDGVMGIEATLANPVRLALATPMIGAERFT